MTHVVTRRRRAFALVVVAATLLGTMQASSAQQSESTYTNPVSKDFADTFADPAIIKAKDGYFYAYGTTDPLREGEKEFHFIPTARSKDLVSWEYVGDAFTGATLPDWAEEDARLWAPDIRYFNGRYYLYYVVTETTVTDERSDNAIGAASSRSPMGPWRDSGEPLVGPRRGSGQPGDFKWTFDPTQFTDRDGTRYLYYGSYYGGIFVTKLSADGLEVRGEPTMVAIDNRYEGAYVVRRGPWLYLFASSGNCCAGPTTGYSVYVGRSKSPHGPFVDRDGDSMTESRVGGSLVVAPNGNPWVGPGHNSIVPDLSGQDHFVYHAIDRSDPYLDEPFGINERPMLLDRLDWIDGWPVVRAGAWASDDPQPAPVTDWVVGDDFNDSPLDHAWTGRHWRRSTDDQGKGYAEHRSRSCRRNDLVSRDSAPEDIRLEGDVRLDARGRAGLLAANGDIETFVEADSNRFVTRVRGTGSVRSSKLPTGFDFEHWHTIVMEIRGRQLRAEISDARLGDPVADHALRLRKGSGGSGRVGAFAQCARAGVDNLGAAALYTPITETVPEPEVGAVDPTFSDEFDDGVLGPEWTWVREPDGEETDGSYVWPTQAGDLVGAANDASVLLRDPPAGDFTVETKVNIDLGVDTVRNYQQGGLIAYAGDDLFARFSHVAIWNTRQTEFGKEMPFAEGLAYGATFAGPPADITWLRISRRTDPGTGEHLLRAASSRDGEHWVHGGVWTLPGEAELRVGLISHGGEGATARFDHVRVMRP